jgi:hypothetical protein
MIAAEPRSPDYFRAAGFWFFGEAINCLVQTPARGAIKIPGRCEHRSPWIANAGRGLPGALSASATTSGVVNQLPERHRQSHQCNRQRASTSNRWREDAEELERQVAAGQWK